MWFVLKAARRERSTPFRPHHENVGWKEAMWGGFDENNFRPEGWTQTFHWLIAAMTCYYHPTVEPCSSSLESFPTQRQTHTQTHF